jgi:hypothetical protein
LHIGIGGIDIVEFRNFDMIKYRLERYTLFNDLTGEQEEFPIYNSWEIARNLAIERAIEMKDAGPKSDPYSGIQLVLELFDLGENVPRAFKILTGARMYSEEILKALDSEREIIEYAGFEVDVMITNGESSQYRSIQQHFVKMFYFALGTP